MVAITTKRLLSIAAAIASLTPFTSAQRLYDDGSLSASTLTSSMTSLLVSPRKRSMTISRLGVSRLKDAQTKEKEAKKALDSDPNNEEKKKAYRRAGNDVNTLRDSLGGAREQVEFWKKAKASPSPERSPKGKPKSSSKGTPRKKAGVARSTANGKTRTSRASNGSAAKSKSTNKRNAQDYEDSDALDDSEEEEEEAVKPKKRAARTNVGSTTRKKRKVSPSEGDEEEEEETKAKEKAKNGKNPSKGKVKVYDSDALDEDTDNYEDDEEEDVKPKAKRRAPAKAKKAKKEDTDEDEYEDDDEVGNLKEGQMVVGKVVQALTTGLVPPGQISNNTLKLLTHLKDPKCNDREWFRLHEPVYRVADQEWKDFVESLTDVLVEVDPQVPHLPTKDVIHRICRDVRFSNDKTPYITRLLGYLFEGREEGYLCKI
ncbi:hypothetical protein BKA70DRAFT_1229401 [Coprinopsis sp. MPI-PUGE-AT-0042]|nr:hypothetical protein BKA70DRAFT_1229401 [Coprinopsis sp. MPI-PUGE-AT-0042]